MTAGPGLARLAVSLGRAAEQLAMTRHQAETRVTQAVLARLPRTVSMVVTRTQNGASVTLSGPGAVAAAKAARARIAAQAVDSSKAVVPRA